MREYRLVHIARINLCTLEVIVAEGHVHLVAPGVFLQSGVIDVGVTVALHLIDRVVTLNLALIHRVLLRPAHHHVERPCGQSGIGVGEHVVPPRAASALVARNHIEVYTGNVTLYLVVRLKHGARIALGSTRAELAVAIGRRVSGTLHLTKGVVGAAVVDVAVGRQHVYNVRLDARTAEPALRHRVLTVIHVALLRVAALVVYAVPEVGDVRIPVAHIAVRTRVGLLIGLI